MIDIYCKDGKCPICGNDIEFQFMGWSYCKKNHCYAFIQYEDYKDDINININLAIFNHFDVFNKRFEFNSLDDSDYIEKIKNQLIEEIKYWKENDRYIAKILSLK